MSATTLLIWACVLLVQNASFTLVSRARNSDHVSYHAVAASLSNSIWFISQFFVVNILTGSTSTRFKILAGLMYTVLTTTSSVAMHVFLMRKVEKKIGAKV